MHVVERQMHLLTGDYDKVGQVAEGGDGLKRGVVAVVIGDGEKVVAVAAVVSRHDGGGFLAV